MTQTRFIILLIGFLIGSSVNGQVKSNRDVPYYTTQTHQLKANKIFQLPLSEEFTAVKLSSFDSIIYTVTVLVEGREFTLTFDTHSKKEIPSCFLVFPNPSKDVAIICKEGFPLKVELFFAPYHQIDYKQNLKTKVENCTKPLTLSQADWRTGLPDPVPGRNSTTVKHCIIHHSAGSNTNTDYLNTVRNIYLLHTQSNGWDDIGYNFVIAPNGDIYSGRDPLGVADEDNIQGAHYCGKNGGTMGVCLLGNYNDVQPTDTIRESLYKLLAWKLHKEELTALDSSRHPNSLGDFLGTVAMHRLGCSTSCPGDSVALLIDSIRYKTKELLDQCTPIVSTLNLGIGKLTIRPNPSSGHLNVNTKYRSLNLQYKIFNNLGQQVTEGNFDSSGYAFASIKNGVYRLEIWSDSKRIHTLKQVFFKP
jgi:hypothetical protein